MLSNCFILLCIGVCATCQTTGTHVKLQTGIQETQAYLKEAMNRVMKTDIPDMVDIPGILTETCAKNNLETFSHSVNSVGAFRSFGLRYSLMALKKHWPSKKGQDCMTSKGRPQELLNYLEYFLNELDHYL